MSITLSTNFTNELSSQMNPYSFLQAAGTWNERHVTYAGDLPNRLVRDSNGSIHLIEKTPAEVVGEKILRPLLDKVASLSSYISSFMPSFPGAHAAEIRFTGSTDRSSCTLRFSSEAHIASCLEKHPIVGKQVSPLFVDEKEIIPAVAKLFAKKDADFLTIYMEVGYEMLDLNERSKLRTVVMASEMKKLAYALADCAEIVRKGEL